MRRLSVTLLLLWTSLAGAADPTAPTPATPAPATAGTPVPPAVPAAETPAAPTTPTVTPAATPAAPVTRDQEAALARELAGSNTFGRAVELQVGGQTVVALYQPQTTARARGAVLLLHDLGGHADWPGVIAPLRRSLPALGWSTLSIQLPFAAQALPSVQRKAWLDQIAPRIDAALDFLKREGQSDVVLAGHGLGAVAALDYTATHEGSARGLAVIALPLLRNDDPRLATGEALGRLRLPVLDIYGSADVDEVAATASLRKVGAGHGGNYLQTGVAGADHFFNGQDGLLTGRIRGWLDHYVAGIDVRRPAGAAAMDPSPTEKTKGNTP